MKLCHWVVPGIVVPDIHNPAKTHPAIALLEAGVGDRLVHAVAHGLLGIHRKGAGILAQLRVGKNNGARVVVSW